MTQAIYDITPGVLSRLEIPANATGIGKIETWGATQGGTVDSASGYSLGSDGGPYQSVPFIIAGIKSLDVFVEAGTPYSGDPPSVGCSVVDTATQGDAVSINSGWGYVGGHQAPSCAGSAVDSGSAVVKSGGAGESIADPDASGGAGGGSSGCPTAAGENAVGSTGGAASGVDSGKGGDGATSSANGTAGEYPGGGGAGGTTTNPGGTGAGGRVRVTIPLQYTLPRVVE